MPRKYTYEEVKKLVSEISKCSLVSTEYQSCTEKLTFLCECGNEFETDLHHFIGQNQRQCPRCSTTHRARSRRLTAAEINARLAKIGCEMLDEDYRNRKSEVTIRCACGHDKVMRINTALSNNFSGLCTECSDLKFRGSNRLTIEQIRAECREKGIELLSSEYRNMREPLDFRCSCGRTFSTSWEIVSYYSKTRCDLCSHRMSFGEQSVLRWLEDNGIEFSRQKRFPGCGNSKHRYQFDFYLPELNACVEFDGKQHFETVDFSGRKDADTLRQELFDTQCRDLVKDIYCEENGIKLAVARCAEKIARKRKARAARLLKHAQDQLTMAQKYVNDMTRYHEDACAEVNEAQAELADILSKM